jgi:vacuolar-type H+-ATPase subunit H
MEAQVRDWRVLSEAASREQDADKLIQLVEELNRALLHREIQTRRHLSTN